VVILLIFSLTRFFISLGQHWFGIVMLLHVTAFIIQMSILLPFEIAAAGHIGSLASVLFLPHAVKVLSVWLLGPKAFLALFPAEIFISYFFLGLNFDPVTLLLISLWGSASAVIAFEFLRLMNLNVYPKNVATINWRSLVFAGCVASFFNSVGGTYLKSEGLAPAEIHQVLGRYLIGDIGGLLFCLIVLMLIMRYVRFRHRRAN
jgi:hypothetical protein